MGRKGYLDMNKHRHRESGGSGGCLHRCADGGGEWVEGEQKHFMLIKL